MPKQGFCVNTSYMRNTREADQIKKVRLQIIFFKPITGWVIKNGEINCTEKYFSPPYEATSGDQFVFKTLSSVRLLFARPASVVLGLTGCVSP